MSERPGNDLAVARSPRQGHSGAGGVRLLAAAAVAAALAGCFTESPERLMASAREHLARQDDAAAVIQLRNVLQQDARHGQARLLLGSTLLRQGDAQGAERELRRALEFGVSPAEVAPALARAMLEQGQAQALVKEFGALSTEGAGGADLRAALGEAQLRLGNLAQARSDFDAALQLAADHEAAQLGLAALALLDGRSGEAMAIAERLIAADARSARAHALRGELLLAAGDVAAGRQSLQRALEADPRLTAARLVLVTHLIDARAFDEAAAQIAAGRKASGGDARLVLLDATLSMNKGEHAAARAKVQQVLKVAPEHVPSLLLAGRIELAEGNHDSAQSHLRKALGHAPDSAAVRRALATAQLRAHQPARAKETLQPLLARSQAGDPGLMLLAGEVHLAAGDFEQAGGFFARAGTGEAQKAAAQTRLGQIALARGDIDDGLKQLEAAAALEGSGVQADLALIAAHLRRGAPKQALAAARALEKKQPRNPISHHMLGMAAAAGNDLPAARAHFGRALELAPGYLPALSALAGMDLAAKRPQEARRRFEELVAREPKNESALLALAEIQARTGAAPKEVGETLQRAIAADPQSLRARVALVDLLVAQRDGKAALAAAQTAAGVAPNDPRVLAALSRAQEAAGEYYQAVESLQRLAGLQPESAQPLQQLAALHLRQRQPERALEVLRRAQRIAPDNGQVRLAMSAALLVAGRPDDALKEARATQTAFPRLAAAHALESEVHASRRDWPRAERAVREAIRLEPRAGVHAIRLHAVLIAAGKMADAGNHARRWLAEHPRDLPMRMHLADLALRAKDYRSAHALYLQAIEIAPDNPIALNNLAWVAGELGDARALEYAERALKLAPNSASILDTMGVLLVKRAEAQRGLEYIERARGIEPARAEFQLSRARALIALGRKDDARRELEALAQRTEPFIGKDTVPELLKGL